VNWRIIFCMFGMALTRPPLTMELTSGVDVFANVCEQKADTSSNHCDNVQPYDKRRFSFCQMWHNFYIVFLKITTNSNFFQKVLWQYTERMWEVLYGFCWKFTSVYSSWKNFENSLRIDQVIAMSLVYYFFGTRCICICRLAWPVYMLTPHF